MRKQMRISIKRQEGGIGLGIKTCCNNPRGCPNVPGLESDFGIADSRGLLDLLQLPQAPWSCLHLTERA